MKSPSLLWSRLALCSLLLAAFTARAEESLSLAGQWRFSRDDAKKGVAGRWYKNELRPSGDEPAEIALPGSTDQAKAGHPNTGKPTLMGLYRTNVYVGPAWYQRNIEIPSDWRGKHVTLFLERNHWTNHVWLDDKDLGVQDSLIAPQVFDLGIDVETGTHRLTLCVDNTLKYDLGGFASIVYEYTQTNWNGIVGKIELRAADSVSIASLQIYPDLDGKKIKVVAKIDNASGSSATGNLQLSVADADGKARGTPVTAAYSEGDSVTAEVPMGDDFKTWDEFSPHLYTLKAVLNGSNFHSEQSVSFGMRELSRKGTQFVLNGHPIYLRGTLECAIFPLTGFPPTDVEAWRRIYRIEKSYGLNFIRFHSWTPPEAAFTAADLEGLYIQTEGPNANIYFGGDAKRDAFLEKEFLRTVETYGNHPSFLLMALGNEDAVNGDGNKLTTGWIKTLIAADSRHLYNSSSGGVNTSNQQYAESQEGRGVEGPQTTRDLAGVVAKRPFPFESHEVGEWAFYPNFDETKKYTGVLEAKNFDIIRENLDKAGMGDQAARFFQATGHLATLLYKEEIEVLLRTAGLGGFSLLDLHDYPGQGTALIGILDPFWDSKGFIEPEEHKRYAGAVVPLLRFPKRVYAVNETFSATAQLAQYGPVGLDAHPRWTLKDADGNEIGSGSLAETKAPIGKVSDLGAISAPLGQAKVPCKATVTITLDGTPYSNSWDIWIYPAPTPAALPDGVVLTRGWDETKEALSQGKKVVFFPTKFDNKKTHKGSFQPIFWSPIWFHSEPATMGILCDPKHPLFAKFPTEFYGNWQWWNLVNGSRSLVLNGTPKDFRPLIQMVDNFERNDKMGNTFEAAVGTGRLIACTLPLLDSKSPEASQLLHCLYDYVGSADFDPKQQLSLEVLDGIFIPTAPRAGKVPVTIYKVDSEETDHPANDALDDDINTFWHTNWHGTPAPPPHYLILDLGKETTLKGVTYRARQDSVGGRVKAYRIYVSDNPNDMGSPVASGELLDQAGEQTIPFASPEKGRYVKFEAVSEVNGSNVTSIAELGLITE